MYNFDHSSSFLAKIDITDGKYTSNGGNTRYRTKLCPKYLFL
jgi:hypothetical protein